MRGLNDPLLVTSDGAPGIIKAIEVCFPRAARQRCLAHRMRNFAAKVPEDIWPDFKARVQAAYQAPSRAIARELAAGIVADYLGIGERFEQTLMNGAGAGLQGIGGIGQSPEGIESNQPALSPLWLFGGKCGHHLAEGSGARSAKAIDKVDARRWYEACHKKGTSARPGDSLAAMRKGEGILASGRAACSATGISSLLTYSAPASPIVISSTTSRESHIGHRRRVSKR